MRDQNSIFSEEDLNWKSDCDCFSGASAFRKDKWSNYIRLLYSALLSLTISATITMITSCAQTGSNIQAALSSEFYLYPVNGADETVFMVKPGAHDPAGAIFAQRHPLSGCKVEVLGDGPGGAGSKQVKILEGEFEGQEGWVLSDCLSKTKRTEATPHTVAGGGDVAWSFATQGKIESSPTINNEIVYFGSSDRNLYALDARTGQEKWRYSADATIDGGITVAGGKIFFGATNGIFYCLRETDHIMLWCDTSSQTSNSSGIYTKPLVSQGLVYFGNQAGDVKALDIKDGHEVWRFKAGAEANASPVIFAQTVYFGSRDGFMYALDAITGKQKWKLNIHGTINDVAVLENGRLYFFASEYEPTGGSLYCIDTQTFKTVWRKRIEHENFGEFRPTIRGNMIYGTSHGLYEKYDEHYLYAINKLDGRVSWKRFIPPARTALIAFEDQLIYGSTNGLYTLNSIDGSLRYAVGCGETQNSTPNTSRRTAFIGSLDKSFYAINIPRRVTDLQIASNFPKVDLIEPVGNRENAPLADNDEQSEPDSISIEAKSIQPTQIYDSRPSKKFQPTPPTDYQIKNAEREKIESLQEELKQAESIIEKKNFEIQSLRDTQNTDKESIQEMDDQIRNLAENIRSLESLTTVPSIRSLPVETSETPQELDVTWPNVDGFLPGKYKFDVLRRLNRNNVWRYHYQPSVGEWKVSFRIKRDGSPADISLATHDANEETRESCIAFVKAAAPFRPLLPEKLDQLKIETTLRASSGQLEVVSLKIEALGNQL
ncbi:MAG: PQQ-binding-like beta-propeller repeat protein [Candidatus Obscuribacterales bacterium]|nr:PQQ-binding-like beta-propeller repeat protein [Candidatus Obscuribacterales bacterium]